MSPLRIFVSHSSIDNDVTREICEQLQPPGQEPPDFEILVDFERLEAGNEWDRQLHEWMGRCHAALLVLTKHAAASPWVLKEATILSQRKAVEKEGFPLFVAQSADVKEKLLKKHKWDPLALGRIQRVAATDPAGIAAEVRAGVAQLQPATTPFDRLVSALGELLAKVDMGGLETVAGKLTDFDEPTWSSWSSPRERLVQAIARHVLCGSIGEYRQEGLAKMIAEIGWVPGAAELRKILRAVAPHWVDGEAVAPVAVLPSLGEGQRRAVAVNGDYVAGSDPYTTEQYVTRAHLADALNYEVWTVPDGNAGDLAEHYTTEICKVARSRRRGLRPDADPDDVIARLRASKQATPYVVLPVIPPADALATLLERFPKLNFVLAAGPALPAADDRLAGVDWLAPEVDLPSEQEWFFDWQDAADAIERIERSAG